MANGTGSRASETTKTINIHMLYPPKSGVTYSLWAWSKDSSNTNWTGGTWPGKAMTAEGDGYVCEISPSTEYDLGVIFSYNNGGSQTSDLIVPKATLSAYSDLYFIYGVLETYTSADSCSGLKAAVITDASKTGANTIALTLYGKSDLKASDVEVKDNDGTAITVSTVTADATSATLSLSNGTTKYPYSVKIGETTVSANIDTSLIDTLGFKYDGDDLGLTLSGTTATFKLWAPTATTVQVLLYTSVDNIGTFKAETVKARAIGSCDEAELEGTVADTVDMTMDATSGVWTASDVSVGSNKYYKYKITHGSTVYYVCDINAKVAAPDSIAAQIVSIDDSSAKPANWEATYTNPFGSTGTETKTYNDAVIYEMHIRDWSRAVNGNSTGKFTEMTNEKIINHLKDLGVTHVQILPMFDYAQVIADENYNWGYNPYHYNVPEGRYTDYTSDKDGTAAVSQMREMIKAFHDAGIAVIMDVVYNHTNGTKGGSLYDSTVPGYFYRQDASGNYYNGSGCGNEVATNHYMVKKYVIDSLKHWMKDYHINGFRFDLMGLLEADTMKDIYDELHAIDENVLVYGEPWTGGTSGVSGGAVAAGEGTSGYGYGAFDDEFRDAIKGGEYGGFQLGEVQGTFTSEANILLGLEGKTITKNSRNATGNTGLALHYAECHDNYTLFDKLVYSTIAPLSGDFANKFAPAYGDVMKDEAKLTTIKDEVKLAGAYVILSQGTPFLNGGQEFLRTKKGDPDSYAADKKGGVTWTSRYNGGTYVASTDIDDVNTIDLTMKETYSDVYNTYKGLIALRKSSTAFTDPKRTTAEKIVSGVTKYTVSNGTDTFEVIFNATDSAYSGFSTNGTLFGAGVQDAKTGFVVTSGKLVKISEEDGTATVATASTDVASVPAKSFVILKK